MSESVTSISSIDDRKKILDAMKEMSDSMFRTSSETSLRSEIVKDVVEKFKLPRKHFVKMSKIYHMQNFERVVGEEDEVQTLYETITGNQTPT